MVKIMRKDELKFLIEPFIYEKLDKHEYKSELYEPQKLLTWNRFDLAFKLLYLDEKEKNYNYAKHIYREDIRSQTLGEFKEFGNKNKANFEKYIETFENTYNSIKNHGFEDKETLVPLSVDNTIINGAHRVASAIHQNKFVKCIKLDLPTMICDYDYFYKRNVSIDVLDSVANKFAEYAENTYIACVWPPEVIPEKQVEFKFINIVYKKDIKLTANGAFNLIYQFHKDKNGINDKENNFEEIYEKVTEYFSKPKKCRVILFQSKNIEEVRKLEEQVRQNYEIEFSSIHITDRKEEVIRISRLIFNKNGLHFLNYTNPDKFKLTDKCLLNFKRFIKNNNLNPNDILISSDFVTSIYLDNTPSSEKIPYISNYSLDVNEQDILSLDDLRYSTVEEKELIYNPKYYFQINGFKLMSFIETYKIKKNRANEKDLMECKIMESILVENNEKNFNNIKPSMNYIKIKMQKKLVNYTLNTLKVMGLYKPIRLIYRKIRDKG